MIKINKLTNGIGLDKDILLDVVRKWDLKLHERMGSTFMEKIKGMDEAIHNRWELDSGNNEDEEEITEFVDLGLPSGTLWATCNVGASSPEEYGYYFAWGETTGYEELTQDKLFTWEDYLFFTGYDENNNNLPTFNKYNSADLKVVLENTDDAAYLLTNGEYRMPTGDEASELINNCTYEFITNYNGTGINVSQYTGPNGKKLIIPASGYYLDGRLGGEGDYSYIWTCRTRVPGYLIAYSACQDYVDTVTYRYYGMPIRPVKNE